MSILCWQRCDSHNSPRGRALRPETLDSSGDAPTIAIPLVPWTAESNDALVSPAPVYTDANGVREFSKESAATQANALGVRLRRLSAGRRNRLAPLTRQAVPAGHPATDVNSAVTSNGDASGLPLGVDMPEPPSVVAYAAVGSSAHGPSTAAGHQPRPDLRRGSKPVRPWSADSRRVSDTPAGPTPATPQLVPAARGGVHGDGTKPPTSRRRKQHPPRREQSPPKARPSTSSGARPSSHIAAGQGAPGGGITTNSTLRPQSARVGRRGREPDVGTDPAPAGGYVGLVGFGFDFGPYKSGTTTAQPHETSSTAAARPEVDTARSHALSPSLANRLSAIVPSPIGVRAATAAADDARSRNPHPTPRRGAGLSVVARKVNVPLGGRGADALGARRGGRVSEDVAASPSRVDADPPETSAGDGNEATEDTTAKNPHGNDADGTLPVGAVGAYSAPLSLFVHSSTLRRRQAPPTQTVRAKYVQVPCIGAPTFRFLTCSHALPQVCTAWAREGSQAPQVEPVRRAAQGSQAAYHHKQEQDTIPSAGRQAWHRGGRAF